MLEFQLVFPQPIKWHFFKKRQKVYELDASEKTFKKDKDEKKKKKVIRKLLLLKKLLFRLLLIGLSERSVKCYNA